MGLSIRVVSVGKLKEKYLIDGLAEYQKRLRPFCSLEFIELRDEGMEKEAKQMEKFISGSAYALDVKGKEFSSEEFSKFVARQEKQLIFIIGSAEGIHPSIKSRCNLISLSKMTFTHDMCRLFLAEQIYRAFMIAGNRPYHK